MMISIDKIDKDVRFDIFESTIEICNMFTWEHYKFGDILVVHRNNNLFA